jgi:hypothetical protein
LESGLRVVEEEALDLGVEALGDHNGRGRVGLGVEVVNGGVTQDGPDEQVAGGVVGEPHPEELAGWGVCPPATELLDEEGDWGLAVDDEFLGLVAGLEKVEHVPDGVLGLLHCVLHGIFGIALPSFSPALCKLGLGGRVVFLGRELVLAEDIAGHRAPWDGRIPPVWPHAIELVYPIPLSWCGDPAELFELWTPL